MKKLLCRLLLICMLLSPAVSHAAVYRDGTYVAYANGMGIVTVTITIKNGRISSVEVNAPGETPGIADLPIEKLPARILEANSVEGVDTIAGATITSRAILEAAGLCLNQAAGGALITPSPTPSPTPTPTPTPKPAVPHPEYQSGTYIGYANGFFGTVTVLLTIKDGYITSLSVDAPHESIIGAPAIEHLPGRIISANTTEGVDVYAGATFTSRGILQAAAACLDQAAGGALITPSPTPSPTPTPTPTPKPTVPHPEYQSGTYIGYANGFFGTVTVLLTIKDGYITFLSVDAPHESIIGAPAIEHLPGRIISANTTEGVDVYASATFTSRGILQAAAQCLNSAVSGSASNRVQTLPANLTEIQEAAFAGCSDLVYVLIPASVKTIDATAFSDCSSLIICTPQGSTAQDFANAHGIPVITY